MLVNPEGEEKSNGAGHSGVGEDGKEEQTCPDQLDNLGVENRGVHLGALEFLISFLLCDRRGLVALLEPALPEPPDVIADVNIVHERGEGDIIEQNEPDIVKNGASSSNIVVGADKPDVDKHNHDRGIEELREDNLCH